MIVTIAIGLYALLLFYIYGTAVTSGLRVLLRADTNGRVSTPVVLLIGISMVSVLASILNLFIPLGALSVVLLLRSEEHTSELQSR